MVDRVFLVASILLLSPQSVVHADVIFTNPITDPNPSLSDPFTSGQTVIANVDASGIGRGSGISANAGLNRYNARTWTTAGSLDTNDFFTFTITPDAGFTINYENFVYTGQASGSGPSMFAFRSSIDGFTTNIGVPNETGTTVSLSAASFQGVATATEFRFYGFDADGSNGTFSINSFTFNGTVVPEPSSVSLLGLLGVWALVRRRKRHA